MRQHPKQTLSFAEGMNKDVSAEFLRANQYVHAQNLELIGNEGDSINTVEVELQGSNLRLTNHRGMQSYIAIPDPDGLGENYSIIGYGSDSRDLVLFTTHELNLYPNRLGGPNRSQIWYVNISDFENNPVITTIDNLVYDGELNFSRRNEIHRAEIVRETECLVRCTWTDAFNPPRSIVVSEGLKTDAETTLSISPGALFPTIEFDRFIAGRLVQGNYQYAVRYLNTSGNATEWSFPCQPINVFSDSHPNWLPYQDLSYHTKFNARDLSSASTQGVVLSLTGLDPNYSRIQVAYALFLSNPGPPSEVKIFYDNTFSGSSIEVSHTENTGTDTTIEEVIASDQVRISSCQDILNINGRMLYANYCESEQRVFDKTGVTTAFTTEDFRGSYRYVLDGNPDTTTNPEDSSRPQYKLGYWRGETYRFGIVLFYKNGGVGFVDHLADVQFPSCIAEPLMGPYNSGGPEFNFRRLAPSFSGIDMSPYVNDIVGFSIVRAKRVKRRIAQGIFAGIYSDFTPNVFDNALGTLLDPGLIVLFPGQTLSTVDGRFPGYSWCSPDTDSLLEQINVSDVELIRETDLIIGYIDNDYRCGDESANPGNADRLSYIECYDSDLGHPHSNLTFPSMTYSPLQGYTVQKDGSRRLFVAALLYNITTPQLFSTYSSYDPLSVATLYSARQPFAGYPEFEDTQYILTGHYQPVDSVNSGTGGTYVYDNQVVWGGDCHLNMYTRFAPPPNTFNSGFSDVATGAITFPVQSDTNPNLRWFEVDPADPNTRVNQTLGAPGKPFTDPSNFVIDRRAPEAFLFNSVTWRENDIRILVARPEDGGNCGDCREASIISSNIKTPGEEVDSHAQLLANETVDLDLKFGPITRIDSKLDGNVNQIYFWQENAFGQIPVQRFNLQLQNAGEIALGTGRYFSIPQYISQFLGGSKHIHSVTRGNESFYWIDVNNQSFWSFAQDGLQDLGEQRGMATWFKNNLKGLSRLDNPHFRGGVSCGYNFRNQTVYISSRINTDDLPQVGDTAIPTLPSEYEPDWTLSFNEITNRFISFHGFGSPFYINLPGNRFLSVGFGNANTLYLHDADPSNRNSFYDSPTEESFVISVFNVAPGLTKRPGYLILDINSEWDTVEVVANEGRDVFGGDVRYRGELPFLVSGRRVFVPKGNKYLGPIPICTDRYINGVWTTNAGLFPLIGEEIFIKLAVNSTDRKTVTSMTAFFTPSRINT